MKTHLRNAIFCVLLAGNLLARQSPSTVADSQKSPPDTERAALATSTTNADIDGLRNDLQRLNLLLNQMRTNLAFVQTSQTPLKHQFELEADAWQVVIEQMERRIKRLEQKSPSKRPE